MMPAWPDMWKERSLFYHNFFFVMKVSQRQLEVMDSLPSCLGPQTGMPW